MTAYDEAKRKLKEFEEKIDGWKKELDDIEKVKEHFPDLNITTSCGFQFGHVEGALIHLHGLTDMKQATPVARILTIMGYHTKGYEDYPELRRRTYNYGVIKLMCFLRYEEGANCEWKQVGVKEEPVYKLFCDGKIVEED